MPFPTQVGLLIAALIVVFILLWLLSSGRRSRRSPHREGRWMRRAMDHGAHIARQHGHERSPEWHRVAMEHRLREPACVVCGYKGKKLQVHHIKPFHLHPQLELDPDNLITLCEARGREHHLLLGHLDSWESFNEHIRADAKHFHRKSAAQIRADLAWQKKVKLRP
jgi:HNH endonuclease